VLEVRNTFDLAWSNGEMGRSTLHLRARVDDDTVKGTMSIVQRQGTYVCESGPVGFTAPQR
jgi:hypothetical protein